MNTFIYFVGGLILASVWIFFFLLRKDLRRGLVVGGLLGFPFGFTEFLFVPEYWNPPSILNLVNTLGFGIESLMVGFFAGGLATTTYRVFLRKRPLHGALITKNFIPYIISICTFLLLEILFPTKTIYNMIGTFTAVAVGIAFMRRELISQIFLSASFFSVLYSLLFAFFQFLFPNYIAQVYSLENFLGVYVFGVPIEESLFAFSIGACWFSFYEYAHKRDGRISE